MIVADKASAANWLAATAVVIAVALPGWQMVTEYGWFGVAFGDFAAVFWAVILVWVLCVVCVLRWQRRWWILITAPVVLYPVVMSGFLLGACAVGNCL